jgi:hypothetical protein
MSNMEKFLWFSAFLWMVAAFISGTRLYLSEVRAVDDVEYMTTHRWH